ncbi:MAG TPA: DNA translocase FtsK [Clostridia bacterium]|nr:DNA translocase FtsK [Clostridia bacterium]
MRKVRYQNTFNRVAGGVLVIIIALFAMLSVFGAFGGVGQMIKDFLTGTFGFAAYAYSICFLLIGIAVLFGFRITLPFTKFLKYFSLFLIGILALHIFSSSAHILGQNYGGYLSECYKGGNTAGGVIMALVSFPIMKALTNAGALILVCLTFLAVSFIYFYPLIRSEVTYQTRKSKVGSKIGAQKEPTITDFSTLSQADGQGGAKLYRVEVDAIPPLNDKKAQKKNKGSDGYNPLFPNAQGHIEDEMELPKPQPYSESGLAKKILLSPQFDEDAYRKYLGGAGAATINSAQAPYATQKRILMDGRLGIDRTGSGLRAEAGKRFENSENDLDFEKFTENAKEQFEQQGENSAFGSQDRNSAFGSQGEKSAHSQFESQDSTDKPKEDLDFSDRKSFANGFIPEIREKSEWGAKRREIPEFKLEDLKQDELNHFREVSSSSYTEKNVDTKSNFESTDNSQTEKPKINGTKEQRYNVVPQIPTAKIDNADGTLEGKKVDNEIAKAEIENGKGVNTSSQNAKNNIAQNVLPSVMPPSSSPRFGSEKLRDAVVRAVNEPSSQNEVRQKDISRTENMSKAERLERLEKMRSERLAKEGGNSAKNGVVEIAQSNDKSKFTQRNDVPRAAQITMDESIEKTIVRRPYVAPPLSLLLENEIDYGPVDDFEQKKDVLVATLSSFNILAEVTDVVCGPTFSLYILQVTMPKGKTINWISVLDHDIAMKMEEVSVRILAPIPGKNAVGIEVPNKHRKTVRLKEILNSPKFNDNKSPFTFALGKNLYGDVFTADIKNLPHLLIAGATGAGKSCCINSLIVSLLYKATPDDLRLILIDPKRVELKVYEKIPHLLMDEIIVDVDKAIKALQWVIKEMDRRTEFFSKNSYRDIDEYNYYGVKDGFPKMPRIAIIIDELADLMAMGKKAVEDSINRLARLARATGIHLIVATQRPSVDVISGTIKNNLPTRIAFKVTAGADSMTVLGGGGADKLLGNGDMLYMRPSSATLDRIQGAFITGEEVRNVVKFICEHNEGYFDEKAKQEIFAEDPPPEEKRDMRNNRNELPIEFFKALQIGLNGELISVTLLQRRLRIGFPKAGNIVDQLVMRNYLGEADGSNKGRKVLISREEFEELLLEHNIVEDDLY